ncbi:hypothetical protein QTH87_23515 [Variovorax sp. J22P168]|uniref:hypothetical protein n=1 Tax=Variovorax jilinensis TaxID=3053513 RepID=UPI00257796CA|nr:hypothetical protein [Variovorax sp. J22P168]MDM0015432.1 hypothetical protein [Variovorax sp. J22P168]
MQENRAISRPGRFSPLACAGVLAMLAGCAVPQAKQPAQAPTPAPQAAPQMGPPSGGILVPANTDPNAAKGKKPLDYTAVVKMLQKGAGDEDKELGRDILFPAMTAPEKRTGYIDINRRKSIFAQCTASPNLAKGNMVGNLIGFEVFDDYPPAFILRFSNCRPAASTSRKGPASPAR